MSMYGVENKLVLNSACQPHCEYDATFCSYNGGQSWLSLLLSVTFTYCVDGCQQLLK